jgi:type I restriction enzyme S subunit
MMKDELKIIPLGEAVAQMKTGSTPSTTHPEYFGGDIPWFTPGDIGSSKNLANSTRTITQDGVTFGKAKLFEKGMLLLTCIGDIGRVGILQQTSSSNQQITALKFNDDIDSDFAYYWFISNKQKLVNQANQAVVPILNNERLSEINFAYPTLTEQKRIASLLARADRLRQLRRAANALADSLLELGKV